MPCCIAWPRYVTGVPASVGIDKCVPGASPYEAQEGEADPNGAALARADADTPALREGRAPPSAGVSLLGCPTMHAVTTAQQEVALHIMSPREIGS